MAAATTRATTPSGTEPFPILDSAPRTPTSIPGTVPTATTATVAVSAKTANPFTSPNPNLLQPASALTFSSADLSPKSDKAPYSPRRSPVALTGVAAMADARRKKQQDNASPQTTPNPAIATMQTLMGAGPTSKPTDGPALNKLSEPMREVAEKIHIPQTNILQTDDTHASPSSMTSSYTGPLDGQNGALTATSNGAATSRPPATNDTQHYVTEPVDMTDSNSNTQASPNEDNESRIAFSYPGPLPPQQPNHTSDTPARNMSFPGVSFQDNKSSPASSASGKRHKCPYCATDFTRHHNLKSHLLTHSQEKPFVCQTCQARFRRLHDLKRHTKLHTGERPHTCDKCGRRFARGDALARHNKGPGGCAGRRSSFGADDDMMDGEGMDGVEYTGEGNDDDDEPSDQHGRRVSEPRKRVHIEGPHDPQRSVYRQHSSTYPPAQHRDMPPPSVVHSGPSVSTSPRDLSVQISSGPGSSYYSFNQHPGSMTESPKPLSPGQSDQGRLGIDSANAPSIGRNRSPSLTTQFQQTHFGRGSGGRTPPQHPPQFTSSHMAQSAPQLPPLSLSTSTPGRPSLSGPGPSMLHHSVATSGNMSNPGSASSHGQSSGNSMRDIIGVSREQLNSEADIWSHFRELDSKFSRMRDEYELRISRLQEEVISLRGQLNNATSGPPGSYPGEARY